MIPDTWYYARNCAMRGVLVRVRLAPFVLLRSCGGDIDMLFAAMSTLFKMRCYILLFTFPWNNENACVRIPADAYMPIATRTPPQSISSL